MRIVFHSVLIGLTVGAAGTPPIDHFTRYADYEQARISPTGKYLGASPSGDAIENATHSPIGVRNATQV